MAFFCILTFGTFFFAFETVFSIFLTFFFVLSLLFDREETLLLPQRLELRR